MPRNNQIQNFPATICRNKLMRKYFREGYTAFEMQCFLLLQHGYAISIRHIYRILASMGLRRRLSSSRIEDIITAINNELQTSAQDLGYRFMKKRLAEQGIFASCETVRLCLSVLDPDGVANRKAHKWRRRIYANRGPNFAIHIDGWDKLKPYGICVHGGIDGFSKRLLWLKACRSNKKPEFIANFFLNYIDEIKGVPRLVCSDAGTENSLVRDIQRTLRANHNDDASCMASFKVIPSTHNVRIERFWGFLKSSHGVFWSNLFKDMVDYDIIDLTDPVHMECIRFVFMPLIQKDLDRLRNSWNSHRMRRNRHGDTPGGKPNVLFHQPELFGTMDYKFNVNENIRIIRDVTGAMPPPELGCSDEFAEIVLTIMNENGYMLPNNYIECLSLFGNLLEKLQQYGN